jgi:glycosyltransferase involved in cell wall biosynthesis
MLCHALKQQTYQNYELIIVDDYAPRDHKAVEDYFHDNGVPLKKIMPSKEPCYKDTAYNQVNALNTGLLESAGDVSLIMEDYGWPMKHSLKQWNDIYNKDGLKFLMTAAGIIWNYKPPERIHDIYAWNEPFDNFDKFLTECEMSLLWVPGIYRNTPWDWHYCAVPMHAWEKMNGLDERYDYFRLYPCFYFPHQYTMNGYKIKCNVDNMFHLIEHKTWNIGQNEWWCVDRMGKPGGYQTLKSLYARSPNCFDLREDRSRDRFILE